MTVMCGMLICALISTAFLFAPGAHAAPVTLNVTGWVADRDREIIAVFAEKEPSIEVNYMNLFGGDQLLVQLAGGSGPDVMVLSWAYSGEFMRSGLLFDLTGLMERDGVDPADFYPPSLAAGQYNGRQYSLPASAGGQPMYVNLDLFEQAGVPLPGESWTWDDLLADARKLARMEGDVVAQAGLANITSYATYFNALYSHGGRVLTDDFNTVVVDSPATREAFRTLQQLALLPGVGVASAAPFLEGKAGMSFYPSDAAASAMAGLRTTSVLSPLGPAGRTLVGGTHQIAINAQTLNLEAAWTFVKFYVSPEAQVVPMRQGYVPVNRRSLSLAPVTHDIDIIIRQIDNSYQPTNHLWGEVTAAFGEAVAALYALERSPEAAAIGLQQRLEAAWAQR